MAGDWIKMEVCTPDKPEVFAITARMGWDDPDLAVGKLFRVWRWFDQQTTEGNAPGVTKALLDRIAGVRGFAEAMESVGWLVVANDGLSLPGFQKHCGRTAKDRAQTAKRVASHKANATGNAKGNGASVTEALPREEKRREEIKTPPNPPSVGCKPKRERKARTSLQTFIARCTDAGEKPISEYRPLLEYVQATGLPMEFVQLCWHEFKREFLPGGSKESRLQADWRMHFLNFVRKGYYRLWYAKADGTYELTTVGIQAKRQGEKEAA